MTKLSDAQFHNEDAARKYLEAIRWPDGVTCPLCGGTDRVKPYGKSMGPGWYHCGDCRRQFTVRSGSVYERSHVPLHKWVHATFLLNSSKKGMSAHQIHRMLGVTYKTAWFMAHRIREAMKETNPEPMGGPNTPVQADETYIGRVAEPKTKTTSGRPFTKGGKAANKCSVVALVSDGKARTFHVANANAETVREILVTNATREAELHTDESRIYVKVGKEFADHKTVVHASGKYVGPSGESTNACENYFSVFKRGMKGVYQHCSEKHLHRYLTEFDYRYNRREMTDFERAEAAHKGAEGKRLTYQQTNRKTV